MAEIKRSIKDYALQIVRELLREKPEAQPIEAAQRVGLDDLQVDDLRKEKIRLEQRERKMLSRLKEVEKQKRQLFEEGVRNAGNTEQRVIARRIKELDVEAGNMDRMLQIISKQMRTINGLLMIKERARMASESGLTSLLHGIDLQELIIYIDKASVDGEFHMDKFDELLRTLEEADAIRPEIREDQDVLEIMKAMQQAREAMDSPEAIEAQYSEMERQIESRHREQELEDFEQE
jgi:hypothetical protein